MQRQGKIPIGLLIDSRLSWRSQIDYISTKISRTVGLFRKIKTLCAPTHPVYALLVTSTPLHQLRILAWRQASKIFLNKILLLQKRVLRSIFFANQRESAIPFFVRANIPPLNIIYFQSVASLVYDVIHENCPDNMLQLFTQIKDAHSYNTRSASFNNLCTQLSRLKTQQNSFSRISAKLWNFIPNSFRNSSKRIFKKKMKNTLFSMLQGEEFYVQIEMAIQLLQDYC